MMTGRIAAAACLVFAVASPAQAAGPWSERVAGLLTRLTVEEKIGLVHGLGGYNDKTYVKPDGALGSAGYVPPIPRLGIPAMQQTDAGQGVGWLNGEPFARHATALPSALAVAASWDPAVARRAGAVLGEEARRYGFSMVLAGAMNLTREPRNGRNFEYAGEDPLLAGMIVGASVGGIQSRGVGSTVKHFALNAQETGRAVLDARIGEAALRESDLLAFEIAIEQGHPASVMTSYNRLNGVYASENAPLLAALKDDWRYPGFVMSDWGGVHSTVAAARAGLDQESASPPNGRTVYFGPALLAAIEDGTVPAQRLDEMVGRLLTAMEAHGGLRPLATGSVDFAADGAASRAAAEAGAVLLKNDGDILPLPRRTRRIAVIGGFADRGVLSGGGSGQVVGPAGFSRREPGLDREPDVFYLASSPLAAIRRAAPGGVVRYAGEDDRAAARLAADSDVAVVFATQPTTEDQDVPSLSLPRDQDALVAAVARANPRTVVVLETGGPVLMPWLNAVPAVLEAWYPGSEGGPAIARLLLGDAAPRGHLPMTFPAGEAQLPRPTLDGADLPKGTPFAVDYDIEGAAVGYKWMAQRGLAPLFPFGHGLTYTRFRYGGLTVEPGPVIAFDVANTGMRDGVATPQVYIDDGQGPRLVGWTTLRLPPGGHTRARVMPDPRLLAHWNTAAHRWDIGGGERRVRVGASATDLPLQGTVMVEARTLRP